MSRATQVPAGYRPRCFAYAPVTLFGRPFQTVRLHRGPRSVAGPTTPGGALPRPRFGLLRFRSPLLAESLLFSSPAGTEMFQFPAFAPPCGGVGIAPDGFPHSDIRGSMGICPLPRLFAACHVLLRLREPQASPMRPFRFPFFFSPFLSHRRSLDSICSITLASDCLSLIRLLSSAVSIEACLRVPSMSMIYFLLSVVPGRLGLPTSTLSV